MSEPIRYSAGLVTAFGAAVRGGYTGTYEQWCQDMANLGTNLSEVREKAAQAASNATAAAGSATAAGNAQGAAEDAQEAAEQAQRNAETAAQIVSQSTAQISQNAADIIDLKSAINDPVTGLATKAPVIIDTASGAIASFDDGADNMPIKKLVVNIEPVQSGTGDPSPENVRPITGWTGATVTRTGKNLLDPNIAVRANAIINNSGEWETSNGLSTTEGFTPVTPNTPYCFSGPLLSTGVYNVVIFYDKDKAFLSRFAQTPANTNAVFTTPPNCCFIRYTFHAGANLALCQLEKGSSPTDFVPYQGNTIHITFPTKSGTVYGGTLDVTNGMLTVDRRLITKDEIQRAESGDTIGKLVSAGVGCFIYRVDDAKQTSANDTSKTLLCESIPTKSQSIIYNGGNGGVIGCSIWWNKHLGIGTGDSTISSVVQFKTWWETNGGNIVYELATPIEITLTPTQIDTLLGTNNIWADCGDESVEYPADTKLYIQKVNKPTDDDMTADTQIASGKYFNIGNNLYLSTTTIPAGDTIIPGTNCQKTNLVEALNALNA